ncbi:MAG: hypothetical protein KatS3mg058_0241 [Roseiflexus sp.]|nr:MAG: hypothetical protein KatS3mg058_0241 [Roseiflexus sp.]
MRTEPPRTPALPPEDGPARVSGAGGEGGLQDDLEYQECAPWLSHHRQSLGGGDTRCACPALNG